MNPFKSIVRKYRRTKHIVALTGVPKSARFFVFWDIIFCCLRYKCTSQEYLGYQFYKYKNRHRKNFLLHSHIKFYNSFIPTTPSLNSKYANYNRYKTELSREIIMLPKCGEDTFLEFINKYPKFVLKPDNGRASFGVRVFDHIDELSARILFHSIEKDTLCENYVYQHPEIAKLNPSSLNTVRVVTIHNENSIEIVSAAIKMGKKENSIADNMCAGGIAAAIDLDTGIVVTPGMDYQNVVYFEHPSTKCQIIGLRIPLWDQVKQLVIDTHNIFLERPIIGWDIAIKESSVEVIEANVLPAAKLMQLDQVPKGNKIFPLAKLQKRRQNITPTP